MKKLVLLSVMAAAFCACSYTTPNIPSKNYEPIPTENLKIKQMFPVSYEYSTIDEGCSEIELLKKFVGKNQKTEEGRIHIDNILDIHVSVVENSKSFLGLSAGNKYKCSLWGMAVEYVK